MELKALANHFFNLYGRRNRIFLHGLRERIDFLNLAVGDLQDAIRKTPGSRAIEIALARVVARVFCVAEHFIALPLVETMIAKYPAGKCSYCQEFPCACPDIRPDFILEKTLCTSQDQWSLKQWCESLAALYGRRNKEKGIENVLNRLFKEVSELSSLPLKVPFAKLDLDEIEKEFALELSDVLAWTIATANALELDLEKAVWDRFGNGCRKCRQPQCICTHFDVDQVTWTALTLSE